jgi:ferrochelatase
MTLLPEPPHSHGATPSSPDTAVLLCNLGTPDAPTAPALRRYLAEFLSDPRVVEIPRLIWWLILHGIILRVRPKKSAAKYARIWTADGSPLKVWSVKQALLLAGYLGQRGHRVAVHCAMRYGKPSVASVLGEMKAAGVTRVLVLPLYPQYSGPTTASVVDAVASWAQRTRALPELRFVNHYHDDPGYIGALAKRVSGHWMVHGRADRLVMSFHGVPQRTLQLGDPYHCECLKTARLLAERLQLKPEQWTLSFQSRFGKAKWLQPYTEPTLRALAAQGVRRVDLICPGFVADCLETLEEIGIEARDAFLAAGGHEFHYIACLNDQHEWIAALSAIALQHLQGWNTRTAPDAPALKVQRERALALGASD